MNFNSFLANVFIFCNLLLVNADLIGYNRYLNRYNGHIMARRRGNKHFNKMKNLIEQYQLFFDMTIEQWFNCKINRKHIPRSCNIFLICLNFISDKPGCLSFGRVIFSVNTIMWIYKDIWIFIKHQGYSNCILCKPIDIDFRISYLKSDIVDYGYLQFNQEVVFLIILFKLTYRQCPLDKPVNSSKTLVLLLT